MVRKGAEAAKMVDGKREEVETVVVEVLDVMDRELCVYTVMVSSNCGHRIGFVGEQTRREMEGGMAGKRPWTKRGMGRKKGERGVDKRAWKRVRRERE